MLSGLVLDSRLTASRVEGFNWGAFSLPDTARFNGSRSVPHSWQSTQRNLALSLSLLHMKIGDPGSQQGPQADGVVHCLPSLPVSSKTSHRGFIFGKTRVRGACTPERAMAPWQPSNSHCIAWSTGHRRATPKPLGCDGSTHLLRQAFQNLEKPTHLVNVPENNSMQNCLVGLKISSLCDM